MKSTILLFNLCIALSFIQAQSIQLVDAYPNTNEVVEIVNQESIGLLAVQQSGKIIYLNPAANEPFLDISGSDIAVGGELGLLGLAFHPDFGENNYFYTNYTGTVGFDFETRISRWTYDVNTKAADPTSEVVLMRIAQPYSNHNGGCIKFGPDGYLYIGMGDGGSGGDPQGFAQNKQSLLGKMLRIDVTSDPDQYTIPADNPFVNDDSTKDEIWTLGMRNPWKFSFDSETGELWIADVGQNAREEIHLQLADSPGGDNYGWNCKEGLIAYPDPSDDCNDKLILTDPIIDYPHTQGSCSITGGYVYRGCDYPDFYGKYFYADFCSGIIWIASQDDAGNWVATQLMDSNLPISTFGEDENGELLLADYFGGLLSIVGDLPFEIGINVTLGGSEMEASTSHTVASYLWYKDDTPIDGATTSNFTPTETGTYHVVVTTENGCEYTSESINYTASNIESISSLIEYHIYPNPFSERLYIDMQLEQKEQVTIEILDIHGKVYTNLEMNTKVVDRSIDTSQLPSGNYLLKVQIGDSLGTQKMIAIK